MADGIYPKLYIFNTPVQKEGNLPGFHIHTVCNLLLGHSSELKVTISVDKFLSTNFRLRTTSGDICTLTILIHYLRCARMDELKRINSQPLPQTNITNVESMSKVEHGLHKMICMIYHRWILKLRRLPTVKCRQTWRPNFLNLYIDDVARIGSGFKTLID